MTLVRWNPVRDLASMEIDRLNRMFDDFYGGARAWGEVRPEAGTTCRSASGCQKALS